MIKSSFALAATVLLWTSAAVAAPSRPDFVDFSRKEENGCSTG
jgi:hypothetical protein